MLLFAVFLARIADDVTTSHPLGYQNETPKLGSMYRLMPGTEIVEVDETEVTAVLPGGVNVEELKLLEVDIGSGVSAGVADDVELEREVEVESGSAELGAPGTGALGCDV
jgi:hypothetical protein